MGIGLSVQHLEAVERRRRIVVNFDVTFAINVQHEGYSEVGDLVESLFGFADVGGAQIDSIWWNWGEGNQAPYPSQVLPLYEHPIYQKWAAEKTDIVGLVLAATQRRGLEGFFSHRMNGSDNDLGPFARIPSKVEHPEWTFRTPWCTHRDNGYWNFALPQVHQHVLQSLAEVLQRWDFDGLELDFARGVVFPQGQGWPNRERLTEFIRQLRQMMLEIGAKRGRPLLLAARVPESLVGCHFDGLDVEGWAQEQLVDIMALGVRAFAVDLLGFRRAVPGVKLYPSIDDHHAPDGYQNPGIEVLRGAAANWWQQGADGVHTFNFNYAEDAPYGGQDWPSHLQAYREIGAPQSLAGKDKVFVLDRRGGGHGPSVVPNPEDWSTPRYAYANTSMLAPLPAEVPNDGCTDALLQLYIADNLAADNVELARLRLLLSDPGAEDIPNGQRLERIVVATIGHPNGGLENEPLRCGAEKGIQVRLNNVLLESGQVEKGWLVFDVPAVYFAVGHNLVGVCVDGRQGEAAPLVIEKMEVQVCYSAMQR